MEDRRPVGPSKQFYTARRNSRRNKNDYMLHKTEWYCKICDNDHNYTLAGKTSIISKPKKHFKNSFTYNSRVIFMINMKKQQLI